MNTVTLESPVTSLSLDARTRGIFNVHRIDTIAQLVAFSPRQLLAFRDFGRKSLERIQIQLESYGLALKPEIERLSADIETIKIQILALQKALSLLKNELGTRKAGITVQPLPQDFDTDLVRTFTELTHEPQAALPET